MEVGKACGLVVAIYCESFAFAKEFPSFPIKHAILCDASTIDTFIKTNFDPLRHTLARNSLPFASFLAFQGLEHRDSQYVLYFLL